MGQHYEDCRGDPSYHLGVHDDKGHEDRRWIDSWTETQEKARNIFEVFWFGCSVLQEDNRYCFDAGDYQDFQGSNDV